MASMDDGLASQAACYAKCQVCAMCLCVCVFNDECLVRHQVFRVVISKRGDAKGLLRYVAKTVRVMVVIYLVQDGCHYFQTATSPSSDAWVQLPVVPRAYQKPRGATGPLIVQTAATKALTSVDHLISALTDVTFNARPTSSNASVLTGYVIVNLW